MANKLLSIALGSGTAKLAEIAPNGRKVSVYSVYDLELSEGLCEDGVILDVDNLAEELKMFISRQAINCKKLVFVIASKRIASKEVVIPFVKEKQIQSIIQTNAPEYFPVSNIEEYAINYSILEVVTGAETKQYRLSVTATPNEILKGYNDLAKALKMPIEVMDHGGNAILQILKSQALSTDVTAILQLGRENTIINIMSSGVLVMQRSVSYGLDAILGVIMDCFRLDETEAFDFIQDNDITSITMAYPEINDLITTMVNSISRIFEFYNSRSAEHQIASVKYIGDGTIVNGIGAAIELNLGVPTEEILYLYNVDIKGKYGITPEMATNFLSNIGAVIKPVRLKYVDMDGDKSDAEAKLPVWMVIVSIVAAVIMVAASFGLYYFNKIKLETLQKQADALQPMRQLEADLNQAIELSNAVDGFYQSTKGPNDSIYRLITDLEEILPEGMSIDALSIYNGRVSISAGGIGKKSVARIITELKGLKYVNDVYVDYVSEVDDLAGKYDTFTISFTLADINAIEFEEQQAAEAAAAEAEAESFDEDFEDEYAEFSEDEDSYSDDGIEVENYTDDEYEEDEEDETEEEYEDELEDEEDFDEELEEDDSDEEGEEE